LSDSLTGDDDGGTSDVSLRNLALSSLLGARGGAFGIGGQFDDGSLFGVIINALGHRYGFQRAVQAPAHGPRQ
jgi:general secretion pathway protein D